MALPAPLKFISVMRTSLGILAFLLAAGVGARAGLFDVIFPTPELRVITVTDVTAASLPLRIPTPAEPVYYLPVCVGYRDFGKAIAGDSLPRKEDMIRVISKVLAKQGYRPADEQHQPTEMILFAWGSLYPDTFMMPGSPPVQFNYSRELAFLGAAKVGIREAQGPTAFPEIDGLTFWTARQDAYRDAAREMLYVAKISAYEFKPNALARPRLLWSTRISGFARRRVMADSLPIIVVIGGPNIGRNTPRPVWTLASEHFKAEVKLGEPKLEEFLDSGRLPVVDLSAGLPKPAK
jgi:hypothetical protein